MAIPANRPNFQGCTNVTQNGILPYRRGPHLRPVFVANAQIAGANRPLSQSLEAYRAHRLSRHQVGQLLRLDYWQTNDFLTQHEATRPYTLADLEIDRQSLAIKLTKKTAKNSLDARGIAENLLEPRILCR